MAAEQQGAKAKDTVAAASPTALVNPDELYPPIIFHGTIFRICHSGLHISQKPTCFRRAKGERIIEWDSLVSTDLQFGCFSGELILKQADDPKHPVRIHGKTSKLQEAAKIIYKEMNHNLASKVDQAVLDQLPPKQAKKVTILDNGLIVKKKTGLFSGEFCFVPWSSVVSADMAFGCCSTAITISTMVHSKDLFHSETPKGAPAAVTAAPAANPEDHAGANYASVTLSGKPAAMEPIFEMLCKLMCRGKEATELESPKILRTTITSTGIVARTRHTHSFLAWHAITSIDYVGGMMGKGTVNLTDRIGGIVAVKKVSEDQFDELRNLFVKETTKGKGEDMPKAIVRKGMRMGAEGLSLPHRHLCSYDYTFYKWKDIDAVEMESSCFGGTLYLITGGGAKDEDADRVKVWKASMFSRGKMTETLGQIRQMKYGHATDENENTLYFAGPKGSQRACRLSDSSVRLVAKTGHCSSITCVLDLDSITDCWIRRTKGCRGKTFICIGVNKAMGAALHVDNALIAVGEDDEKPKLGPQDQTLIVTLKRNEAKNAARIKGELIKRMQIRKKDEAKVVGKKTNPAE